VSRALALVLVVAACRDPKPLPSCASLGCAGPLLCGGKQGPCSCPTDAGAVECTPGDAR
jgi:hypothetical protein